MNRKIYIAKSTTGLGIFAQRQFTPGDHILSFSGRKVDRHDPIHFTEEGANLLQTGKQTYILPNPPGIYVNHSCNPNAGIHKGRRLIALKYIEEQE